MLAKGNFKFVFHDHSPLEADDTSCYMLGQLVEEDQVTQMAELLAQITNFKSNWGKGNSPQMYLLNGI